MLSFFQRKALKNRPVKNAVCDARVGQSPLLYLFFDDMASQQPKVVFR